MSPPITPKLIHGFPFFVAGGLKIVYDLMLFFSFRRLPPPAAAPPPAA